MQVTEVEATIQANPREGTAPGTAPGTVRNRLPAERRSVTHKFSVGGHEGYLIVGLYPDGRPGEIFITMAKEGSTVSGLINSFAQAVSIGLQHGVPLKLFCDKYSYMRFEPSGWTGNQEIAQASSVMDYIFRWLHIRFIGKETIGSGETDLFSSRVAGSPTLPMELHTLPGIAEQSSDAPSCIKCGALMVRNGSCYGCRNCGSTRGCS